MLEITKIQKKYKNKTILSGADFKACPGQCVGIVGGNGSGKTTLLSIIAGVLKADAGKIEFHGEDVTNRQSFYAEQVAYVPQENPIIEELSVRDNLRLWYKDFGKSELADSSEQPYAKLGLQPYFSLAAGKLSGGMKKRLSIACALSNDAPVLVLDEPGAALDLVCKQEIREYLMAYKKRGGMIILTSHEIEELSVCDQMYILKAGILNEISTGLSARQLMNFLI